MTRQIAQIQLRRGTTAQWASADPVLARGEMGVDIQTFESRIGDGVLPWSQLPTAADAATNAALAVAARDAADIFASDAADSALEASVTTQDGIAAVSALTIQAQAAASATGNDVIAASSAASAANTALLALGQALVNGIGAFSVNTDGELVVQYNDLVVDDLEIDTDGNFLITYEVG
jgi:hypothetical protein